MRHDDLVGAARDPGDLRSADRGLDHYASPCAQRADGDDPPRDGPPPGPMPRNMPPPNWHPGAMPPPNVRRANAATIPPTTTTITRSGSCATASQVTLHRLRAVASARLDRPAQPLGFAGPWLLGGLIPMFVGIAQVINAVLNGARIAGIQRPGATRIKRPSAPPPNAGPSGPPPQAPAGPYAWRPGSTPEIERPVPPPDQRS